MKSFLEGWRLKQAREERRCPLRWAVEGKSITVGGEWGLSKAGAWRSYCVWAGWCGMGEAERKKVTDKAMEQDRA